MFPLWNHEGATASVLTSSMLDLRGGIMNAWHQSSAAAGIIASFAWAALAQSAPTEYSTFYRTDPVSGQSSGIGRFIHEPKYPRVNELEWDFGNGWTGFLDDSFPQDADLPALLFGYIDTGSVRTVRHTPPFIGGAFDSAQWQYLGFTPGTWFSFTRPEQPDFYGSLTTRKRRPEVHSLFVDHFQTAPYPDSWTNEGWGRVTGVYESGIAANAISVVNTYESPDPQIASTPVLSESDAFWVSARIANRRAQSAALAGIVYNYQDANNFNEVVFSALGSIQLREIRGGVTTTVNTDAYEESGRERWVDLEVRRASGRTSVVVNGVVLFNQIQQSTLPPGKVGVIAHGTAARADDFRIARPLSRQPFKETFARAPSGWKSVRGNWSVASGSYVAPVQQTAMVLSPARGIPLETEIASAVPNESHMWAFRARMLNPYRGSGNLVGLTWNDGLNEIVFSGTGTMRVNRLDATGRVVALITESGVSIQPNQWFDVEIAVERGIYGYSSLVTNIYVNGELTLYDLSPNVYPEPGSPGAVGLVTHWAPGRFDQVEFRVTSFPRNFYQSFDYSPDEFIAHRGRWQTTNDATYESVAVGQRDVVTFAFGGDGDSTYRARLLNQYGASGNWVGLVTNYNEDGDYYETVFSATGEVRVNKIVKGQIIRQATARHTIPRNTWFTVELQRTGTRTAVKLNGRTILTNLPQGQIRGGHIGLTTHWSRGRFDDLSWTN